MAFLLISIGLIGLVCIGVLVTLARRSLLGWIAGVLDWVWACGLMIAASLLFGEGATRSSGGMRVVANTVLMLGLFQFYASLTKLGGRRPRYRAWLAYVVLTTAVLAWQTWAGQGYAARALVALLAQAALFSAGARAASRVEPRSGPARGTFALLAFLAALSCLRFVAIATGYEASDVLEAASLYQQTYLRLFGYSVVALIVTYMLLVGSRLQDAARRLRAVDVHGLAGTGGHAQGVDLAAEVSAALRRGEFVVHYQPRVHIASGDIVGVEALVRWQHPQRGLLLPGEFVPACERSDAIVALGAWVLEEACTLLERLQRDTPFRINVSVNVSARQIRSADFADLLARRLADAPFEPAQLELELTESHVVHDHVDAGRTLASLKALGLHVAIDDFGTGYSSLAYIRDWPVDCVKIDRSFVNGLPYDAGCVAITRAIVAMGQALRLKVVAEGVEHLSQLGYLRAAGCDEYQGYLAAKPLPGEELVALLGRWESGAGMAGA